MPLSVPRPEGEDDQRQAHDYGENPDEGRQGLHIGAHQDCKDHEAEYQGGETA